MGGRGASSGMSVKGKPYGSEFKTIIKESAAKSSRLYGPVFKISQTAFPYLLSVKDKFLSTESERT